MTDLEHGPSSDGESATSEPGKTISERLPSDFRMTLVGLSDMNIHISLTIKTLDHVLALRKALEIAIIPMLEMKEQKDHSASEPSS